jgi:hypothetical protein
MALCPERRVLTLRGQKIDPGQFGPVRRRAINADEKPRVDAKKYIFSASTNLKLPAFSEVLHNTCGASSKEGNIMKKIATALIAATATVLALANPGAPAGNAAAPQASATPATTNAAAPATGEKHAKKAHEKKAHRKGETANTPAPAAAPAVPAAAK